MTHPFKGAVAIAAVTLLLSGCSDLFESDSGNTDTDPDPSIDGGGTVTTASYDDQIIESLDLNFALDGASITPADQIPATGMATYTGVVGFATDNPATDVADFDIMSDLTLQTDFGSGAVTGTMGNFNTREDVAMDGQLTLTEGQIAGTGFTANAIGAFTDGTTAEIWDLDVVADFVGAGGSGIVGTANGTISNGGSETSDVFGEVIAQQD